MAIITVELASILLTIYVIMKLKINKKFVAWLLKGVKIYLPPNDKDFELICDLKKDKSKNPKANTIVRICQVDEYIELAKDENYEESDLTVFFYLSSLVNTILVIFLKIFNWAHNFYFSNKSGNENFDFQDMDSEINNLNVVASFVFITITYIFYILFKNTFKNGFKSYDARVFYILVVSAFILNFIFMNYFENAFYFDHSKICNIINNRLESISNQASSQELNLPVSPQICNKQVLNVFYSFIFSFFIAILFKSSKRLAYFDDLILSSFENIKQNSTPEILEINNNLKENLKGTKKVEFYCKLKQIIITLLPLLIIDPFLKNYLVENKILSEFNYYTFVVSFFIISQFILGLILMRYYSTIFLNQNYYEMIDFCAHPDKNKLPQLRVKMNYFNTLFWEIFLQLFLMMFLNFVVFIFFIDRSDAITKIMSAQKVDSDFKFKTSFVETLAYFLLLAIVISQSIFTNCYTYYLRNIKKDNKKLLFI